MERKKGASGLKLVKLKDATKLINQHVNLLGFVIERREPKRCRNNDWICTLGIIDDSYPSPGLTVNVFSDKLEKLPCTDNHHDRMILFMNIKMKVFDAGVNGACDKRVSSFALYKRGTSEEGFVCYQCTSNFHGGERYKSSIDELAKYFSTSRIVDQALTSSSVKTKPQTLEFSFLREIKEGKLFNLLCKILHVSEDMRTIFVWDGTDAPPAPIGFQDESVSNLSVHTLLSRDILLSFPTVGTILRVSLSNPLFHGVKPGDWVKLYQLLCVVDKGSWICEVTDSTTVCLAQDDRLVEKIMRIYDKRMTSKMGHIPFWCFPSPGLTETTDDQAQFVSLLDILTFSKVTHKYRCIVRVVAAFPSQVEEFSSDENRPNRVLLTLEDPTATLEAFLCDKEAEHFWGLAFKNTEMLKNKWNQLLGIRGESSAPLATRNPPWIECRIFSYYTNEADPWGTRSYRIFGTRFLDEEAV